MRPRLAGLLSISRWLSAFLLAGRGTIHLEVTSLDEVSSDTVVIVGRVELIPR